jgi:hypothetical protein
LPKYLEIGPVSVQFPEACLSYISQEPIGLFIKNNHGENNFLLRIHKSLPKRIKGHLFAESGFWKAYNYKEEYYYVFEDRTLKIDLKSKQIDFYNVTNGEYPLKYPYDIFMFLYAYVMQGSLMLHSCGVEKNKKANIFIGPAGGGKSTIARILNSKNYTVLNDEKTVLDASGNLYGTPWHGEYKEFSNTSAPISKIVILENKGVNKMTKLSRPEAFQRIYVCHYSPIGSKVLINKIVENIHTFVDKFECYSLSYDRDRPFPFLNKVMD